MHQAENVPSTHMCPGGTVTFGSGYGGSVSTVSPYDRDSTDALGYVYDAQLTSSATILLTSILFAFVGDLSHCQNEHSKLREQRVP
jgi:hypothetical protein